MKCAQYARLYEPLSTCICHFAQQTHYLDWCIINLIFLISRKKNNLSSSYFLRHSNYLVIFEWQYFNSGYFIALLQKAFSEIPSLCSLKACKHYLSEIKKKKKSLTFTSFSLW